VKNIVSKLKKSTSIALRVCSCNKRQVADRTSVFNPSCNLQGKHGSIFSALSRLGVLFQQATLVITIKRLYLTFTLVAFASENPKVIEYYVQKRVKSTSTCVFTCAEVMLRWLRSVRSLPLPLLKKQSKIINCFIVKNILW